MAPIITSGVGRAVQVNQLYSLQGEMNCFLRTSFFLRKHQEKNYHVTIQSNIEIKEVQEN